MDDDADEDGADAVYNECCWLTLSRVAVKTEWINGWMTERMKDKIAKKKKKKTWLKVVASGWMWMNEIKSGMNDGMTEWIDEFFRVA